MILFACVDDRKGMAFNRRRQSSDRAVCEDMLRIAEGRPIGMDIRSQKLFGGLPGANTLPGTGEGCELYFVEFVSPLLLPFKPERIVLYRWNRHYPADLHFDLPLEGYRLEGITEFKGNSHEKIAREVYAI